MAQQGHQHEQPKPEKSNQAQRGDFDLRFLEMTAMHHEMGVKMSELAEEKAQNAELKGKAKQMVDEQRQEIGQLDQLRTRLYPDAGRRQSASEMMGSMHGTGTSGEKGAAQHQHEGQSKGMAGMHEDMHKGGTEMMGQMNRLEKLEGAEFDRAFAKAMIQHHQMQVKMSQRAIKDAKHDEVQQIAKETLERQKRDIAELQKFAGASKSNR
jgi:uncharacterized protein (DUF305 family)